MMAATLPSTALLYPFTLGLIATVNPCGFPLLPVYLNFFVGRGEDGPRPLPERAVRGMVAGSLATTGFVVLFGAIGLVVELGLSAVFAMASSWSRWLMAACGIALVVMGLVTVFGRPLRVRLPELRPGLGLRRPLALVAFGLAYGVASLGCALPLFLGGVAGTFTRSGAIKGLSSFVAYALGMGFLFTVLAVVLAVAGPAATRRLRVVSRIVPMAGGVVLVAVGAYLTLYWTTAIISPAGTSAPVRTVESFQNWVATFLGDHPAAVGVSLCVVLVGTLVTYAVSNRRLGRSHPYDRRAEPVVREREKPMAQQDVRQVGPSSS